MFTIQTLLQKFKNLPAQHQKRLLVGLVGLAFLVVFLIIYFVIVQGRNKHIEPTVPVRVAEVIQKPITITFSVIGNVQALARVSVRSRVAGPLVKMAIKEGQHVKQNDLLFLIDPRPYESLVQHAEAALARDQAQLEKAQFDYDNYSKLVQSGAVSQEQYRGIRSSKSIFEAAVKGDQADLDSSKLQLSYTEVRSPIDGVAGNYLTDIGTVVKADETDLVVITQVQPIYVSFFVPESRMEEIKNAMTAGFVKVQVSLSKDKKVMEEGKIVFINNEIDKTTGTIQMKAELQNKNEIFIPGEFVDVDIVLAKEEEALVVPVTAIQKDNNNISYVYVVNSDMHVERRNVTVLQISETQSWVSKGLSPGERVVIEGVFQLVPGSKVVIPS